MKYLIALFIALTLFGCAKDNITAPVEPASNPLIGRWAYHGNPRMEFTANTFIMYEDKANDWVPYPGQYSYTIDGKGNGSCWMNHGTLPPIDFTYSVSSDGTTLVFNCNGVSYIFQRI